jgi:capsular exopolysaccharide synthesis family protein
MTLMDYLSTLRRYWIMIVVVTVLGGIGGYLYAENATVVYKSSTSVLVTSELGGSGSELLQGSTYVENLVSSYVVLATSEKVLQPVIDDLGLDTTSQSLAKRVTATSPVNTVLIDISVEGSDRAENADIADAVARSLSDAVADVSPKVDGKPAIRLTTMQAATVPTVPVEPKKKLIIALGAFLGLLLSAGFALARRALGSAITTPADVARVTDVPVVGEIVETKRGTTLPGAVLKNSLGIEAESLRGLTANLSFLGVGSGVRSLVITSAASGESKSSVAAATALVLAEASHKVLLIDADLRAPAIHRLTNLDNSFGLSTVLIGEDGLDVAAQSWGQEGLDVLTSGPLAPNPGSLLSSEPMRSLIAQAEEAYDFVIIDSAPLLSVADAVWLGHMATGVLVVTRYRKTTTRSLHRALETLASSSTTVSGIIIGRIRRSTRTKYAYTATATHARN